MPSTYLSGPDLANYGVPNATPAQVIQASALVDTVLKRPEGLVWAPDANGAPCYMAALSPVLTFTAPGAISPGQNVVVPVTGGMITNDLLGEVLVLDRSNTGVTEAVVVSAVAPGQITLQIVAHAHSTASALETGLVITEERPMAAKRAVTRVSRPQMVRLVSGLGRYAYGRRSDQVAGLYNDTNLLAALQTFGGPPAWVPFDVAQASISTATGEVWIPAGLMLAYYSDVRLRYLAGYPAAGVPAPVKQAAAQIVAGLANAPQFAGNVKMAAAGDTKLERFAASMLDTDTITMLAPFEARLFF